jgi:hypothetical protein
LSSGSIGTHYRERQTDLDKTATDENLKSFAQTETEWSNRQPGGPGRVGVRDELADAGADASENQGNAGKDAGAGNHDGVKTADKNNPFK